MNFQKKYKFSHLYVGTDWKVADTISHWHYWFSQFEVLIGIVITTFKN